MHFFFIIHLKLHSSLTRAGDCMLSFLGESFLSHPKIPKRLLKSRMVEKSSHLSMEELFAHNLHSEGKTLKDKIKNTTETKSSVCSLLGR
uniref:Uncharacterized protein n=1 Tax=Rhipicephalus appendiculatus TaxID=34631 RepID=A0A131YCC8_RHIAP